MKDKVGPLSDVDHDSFHAKDRWLLNMILGYNRVR